MIKERMCKKCGETKPISKFYHNRAQCKECYRKQTSLWQRSNRSKRNESARKWQENHKEQVREKSRKYHTENRDKLRTQNRDWVNRNRFRRALINSRAQSKIYGYEPCAATVEEIRSAFTGYCYHCGAEEDSKKLHLDHDHKTGKFRAWLCAGCNLHDVLGKCA